MDENESYYMLYLYYLLEERKNEQREMCMYIDTRRNV